jgi:hypothetical protein
MPEGAARAFRVWQQSGGSRVAAFWVFARSVLADLFSTIGHCAWRHFISLSNGDKETKQRKRLSTIGS